MRTLLAATCLTFVFIGGARAQVISTAADDVEVTIYRGPDAKYDKDPPGLAMIVEERSVELPGGPVTIQFRGVADLIVPQTAKLEGLPAPAIESNFDFDLLSPATLTAKSIGNTVHIVRTNRDNGVTTEQRGVLRSGPTGVMLEVDGRMEALGCSGLDEHLVFDSAPANLFERPTLSMRVNAPPGRYKIRLSYLTLGINWSTDYVAKLKPDGRTLELSAWVTLTNKLSAAFKHASVKVIAGDLSFFADETTPPELVQYKRDAACWRVGDFHQAARGFPVLEGILVDLNSRERLRRMSTLQDSAIPVNIMTKQSELGDYKLYSLPERTDVAANQTKQVHMLAKNKVRFDRIYVQRFTVDMLGPSLSAAPLSTLRLANKSERGLGLPLPSGIVTVMENTESGTQVLVGEDTFDDVPIGSPLEIKLGEALDAWAIPRIVTREKIGMPTSRRSRIQVEVLLGNDKNVPVTLEIRHENIAIDDVHFASESKAHTLKEGAAIWTFKLSAGTRAALKYTIETNE